MQRLPKLWEVLPQYLPMHAPWCSNANIGLDVTQRAQLFDAGFVLPL